MTSGSLPPKEKKRKYIHPKLIICEGKMDRLIVERLIKVRSIPQNFDIFDASSKDNIHFLISEAILEDIKSILIIADNDDKPDNAFKNIQSQIKKGGTEPPSEPKLFKDKALPIDILMLPDTGKIGAIEAIALKIFKQDMKNKVCVNAFVECISQDKNWLPQQKDKLSLAAFVAGSEDKKPDISIADYFGNGVKDIPNFYNDSAFDMLANYIHSFSKS